MCVSLQSIVEGEINVAQAAAFMVLLHSKVRYMMEQRPALPIDSLSIESLPFDGLAH